MYMLCELPAGLSLPSDHLGLYVHIPFCVRKCRYCDFASRALPVGDVIADRYLDALARESARRRSELARPLHSIYIGGGTPTVLTGRQLRRLWEEVIAPFPRLADAEITLEANPGTLNEDTLAALGALPITRVSLGAQSFKPAELTMLGRIHSPAAIGEAVHAVRQAGISQVNIDLIYALPEQTVADWLENLRQALALYPEHLSCYSLILEEETPISQQVSAGVYTIPGEEEEEAMIAGMAELLAGAGLRQYEVSNAARPGAHSRHNLGYWLGRDYLGLGTAAVSACGTLRWRNSADTEYYIDRLYAGLPVIEYAERLSAHHRLLERVMLGLRLRDGFHLASAEDDCGCSLREVAGDALATLCAQQLLEQAGEILRLTPNGYRLANLVVSRLMLAADG